MRKYLSQLNIVTALLVLFVLLVGFGVLPRAVSLIVGAVVFWYLVFFDYDQAVLLFVRMIPFFVALPITSGFDSLNIWRPAVLILFIRWILKDDKLKRLWGILKENTVRDLKHVFKAYSFESGAVLLFGFAFLSLFVAVNPWMGIEKVILFLNLAGFYPVIYSYVRDNGYRRLASSFTVALVLVVAVGFFQLATAYILKIDAFFEFWAGTVQKNFYGRQWSKIAFRGNTWFVYPEGGAPRLRMFSTFPDSHSFPLFLLAALPFLYVLLFKDWAQDKLQIGHFFSAEKNYKRFWLVLVVLLAFLAIILTGTRGMWVSFFCPVVVLLGVWIFQRTNRRVLKTATVSLLIFLVVVPLAAAVFSTSQFQAQSPDNKKDKVFLDRVRSVTNTSEKSNRGRIIIWTESIKSILKNPLLGVGIGNFPVILSEPISYVKAGSTAHNLYLHIAAVMGIPALLLFLALWLVFYKQSWVFVFKKKVAAIDRLFVLTAGLFLVWILGYSLTDAALYDSRAFLGFIVLVGSVRAVIDSSS